MQEKPDADSREKRHQYWLLKKSRKSRRPVGHSSLSSEESHALRNPWFLHGNSPLIPSLSTVNPVSRPT
ncbi:MAG: hypothetical protein ACXWPM_03450, partial [Bdellovibrionota bacterium]